MSITEKIMPVGWENLFVKKDLKINLSIDDFKSPGVSVWEHD